MINSSHMFQNIARSLLFLSLPRVFALDVIHKRLIIISLRAVILHILFRDSLGNLVLLRVKLKHRFVFGVCLNQAPDDVILLLRLLFKVLDCFLGVIDYLLLLVVLLFRETNLISDLLDLNLIGSNIIDKLVDVVERHSSLNLLHDVIQRHFGSLDIQFSLGRVFCMLSLIPLIQIRSIILEDIFQCLWPVLFNDLSQEDQPFLCVVVCFKVVN